MSYEPKTWECGETITAEDLNHIENGIANAGGGGTPLIVNSTWNDELSGYVLDHTWQEIYDAMPNVVMVEDNTDGNITQNAKHTFVEVYYDSTEVVGADNYYVAVVRKHYDVESFRKYYCASPIDYPYYAFD